MADVVAVADAAEIDPLPPPASYVVRRPRAGRVSESLGKAGFLLAFGGNNQDCSRTWYWPAAEPR